MKQGLRQDKDYRINLPDFHQSRIFLKKLLFVMCPRRSVIYQWYVSETLSTIITLSIRTDRPEQTVDPDHMPQNVASDQGLHCCPLIRQYFKHISGTDFYKS